MQRRSKISADGRNERRAMKSLGVKRLSMKIPLLMISVVVAGVITYTLIRMVTADTKVGVVPMLGMPEFRSADDLPEIPSGRYAVMVNRTVIRGESANAGQPATDIAKLVLALTIMQKKPFNSGTQGELITIDETAAEITERYADEGRPVNEAGVGQMISEYDALLGVMNSTADNMADILAIWAFGSQDEYRDFAIKMLAEWGINDTKIGDDASGLSATTTTTPPDAIIGMKVLENPVLAEMVRDNQNSQAEESEGDATKLVDNTVIMSARSADDSGYSLVSSFKITKYDVVLAVLGTSTEEESYEFTAMLTDKIRELMPEISIVKIGDEVGYLNSWWTGRIPIKSIGTISGFGWEGIDYAADVEMNGTKGEAKIKIGEMEYSALAEAEEYPTEPTLIERLKHAFGWSRAL